MHAPVTLSLMVGVLLPYWAAALGLYPWRLPVAAPG